MSNEVVSYKTVCGNCYQSIVFTVTDLELRPRYKDSDYPNGFLMIRCSNCECLNPPSGMLGYEAIRQEWAGLPATQTNNEQG